MTKTVAVLWLTLAATLAASWTHLATLFARHEWPGWWPVAALAATAVDLGILASMMAIGDLASEGRDTSDPKWTVAGLVLLSCLANAAHVLAVGQTGGRLELALAILVAASLPLIVWRLSRHLDQLQRPVATPAPVAAKPRRTVARKPADPSDVALEKQMANGRVYRVTGADLASTNGHGPAWLASYLATVASVGQADADVARAMGVSERTARRYRAAANGAAAAAEGGE